MPPYGDRMDEPHRRIDAVAAESGFSGVVRLERDGVVEVDAAYGLADRAHQVPMTTATRLGIASGSKTMTALVVLRLVEDGRVDLATTARSVLGTDLPLIADDVTLEHLLAHRSGIGDYLDEDELDPDDYPMPVSVHRLAATEDFLPILDGHATKFPAGERFSYCNGGYVVLALVAERTAGRSYHDLVRELVLAPAGMTDSGFLRSDDLPGTAATGYVEVDGHWRTNVFHLPVLATGDGGMFTTSGDVSRFWRALFDGAIVGPETLATMLRDRSPSDPDKGRGYGLGCWLRPGSREVALIGSDAGVSFASQHDPELRYTHTVISNTSNGAWPVSTELDAIVGVD
jgi:CubicO group peptidase (beta-lactamase class C family)